MKREIIKTEKYTQYFCDICEKELHSFHRCKLCNRWLCLKHTQFDPRDLGDYPDQFCQECWNIGEKYRKLMVEIEEEADIKIEVLNDHWKEDAIKSLKDEKSKKQESKKK